MAERGMGRGLAAILAVKPDETVEELRQLPVDLVAPNPNQPRRAFDEDALLALADSIGSRGVLQPVLVRPLAGRYELIAGERRWRAAQMAGLTQIPAVVRDVPDGAALVMALIENIQREDLNPMEQATAVQRLVDEFKMTHEQAADAVGRSRSATTNLLRLLRLARPVQEMLMRGTIEMGHARALLPLDGARQIEVATRIGAKQLSVRETEALVQRLLRAAPARRKKRSDRDLARLEEELSERLGTTVEIRAARKGGKLVVHYSSVEHLEQLLKRLK